MAKGELLIIGGAEDKDGQCRILQWFVDKINQKGGQIVVITTATKSPREVGTGYLRTFKELGGRVMDVLNIDSRLDAHQNFLIQGLKGADGIFFTGGDQLRITSILGGTPALEAVYHAYDNGAIIAGTSAGAAIMSETMIVEGEDDDSPRRCTVKMASGLGLLKSVVVDMHFSQRGRQSRLITAIGQNPNIIGIGIDEDTAIVVGNNEILQVIGSRTVWIVDGREIAFSNVSELAPDEVLALTNVCLHIIPEGYGYDLRNRLILQEKEPSVGNSCDEEKGEEK